MANLESALSAETRSKIPFIFSKARILGDDIALPAPADADEHYQKKGCPLEGMMYYDGELDQLQISPSVFDKLASNTDIAAAKIHEALYFVLRNKIVKNTENFGLSNSVPVRKLVGCLFSENSDCLNPVMSKDQALKMSEAIYSCENNQISYFLFKRNLGHENLIKTCGGNTIEQWIGILNRIEDDTLGTPELFVVNTQSTVTGTCSSFKKFSYTHEFNATKTGNDPSDGHPLLKNFSGKNAKSNYGTPVCKKIK